MQRMAPVDEAPHQPRIAAKRLHDIARDCSTTAVFVIHSADAHEINFGMHTRDRERDGIVGVRSDVGVDPDVQPFDW